MPHTVLSGVRGITVSPGKGPLANSRAPTAPFFRSEIKSLPPSDATAGHGKQLLEKNFFVGTVFI